MRDGTRDGDALALPARELGRIAFAVSGHADEIEQLRNAAAARVPAGAALLHAECNVLRDGQVREQGVVLEHHADVAPARRQVDHVAPIDQDAAGGRVDEPGDDPQRRRLAAAGRSQQREKLAVADIQIERLQGNRGAVAALDPFEPDLRHGLHGLSLFAVSG